MVDYMTVAKKINELQNSNRYSFEQLEVIKYAMYLDSKVADFIMDPSLSAETMKFYIALKQRNVPIEKYIQEKWHEKGFSYDQLYNVIMADNVGIDISQINPSIPVEQIKSYISYVLDSKDFNRLKGELVGVSPETISMIEHLQVPFNIKKFLANMAQEVDITEFVSIGLENYSFEQVKYLYTVYSLGQDISKIARPELSVEQMKKIMSYSPESLDFLEEIASRNSGRK